MILFLTQLNIYFLYHNILKISQQISSLVLKNFYINLICNKKYYYMKS
jgi:hypothetical protein